MASYVTIEMHLSGKWRLQLFDWSYIASYITPKYEIYIATVQPYAYGTKNHTIHVWYVSYTYGMHHMHNYGMKYTYNGTEQL